MTTEESLLARVAKLEADLARLESLTVGSPMPQAKAEGIVLIRNTVSEAFRVDVKSMLSPSRIGHICEARQAGMWLMRQLTDATLDQISQAFQRTDHGSAFNACERIDQRREAIPALKKTMDELLTKLRPAFL